MAMAARSAPRRLLFARAACSSAGSAIHTVPTQQRWASHSSSTKDPWHWIKDPEHPKLQKFLQTERAYLAQQIAKPRFRKIERTLYLELRRRLLRKDATIPERIGSYEYFLRQSPGENFQVYCRRHRASKREETVLDQNRELELAHDFQFVTAMKISHDERWLLLVMENENEECRAFVKDLRTQTLRPLDALHAVRNAEWCNVRGRKFFYYTRVDAHRRPYAVYRYDCDAHTQELIYEEHDESFFVDVSQTKDGAFVLINCNSKSTSEIHALASTNARAVPQLLRPREPGTAYFADHAHDAFYIVTNADRAANYKIVTARSGVLADASVGASSSGKSASPSVSDWTTLLPESPDVKIEDLDLFRDYLVLYERVHSVPRIRVCDLRSTNNANSSSCFVPLPREHAICRISPGVNRDFDAHTVRFAISTPLVPEIVYDFDMATAELHVLKEVAADAQLTASSRPSRKAPQQRASRKSTPPHQPPPPPRAFDPAQYTCERVFVPSRSSLGVDVPLTLVHRRDVARDGSNPTLLLGYGAYGTNLEAQFELEHLSLLERGWVIALAHARGGGELGLRWYHDGRGLRKRNTFDDYLSCATHLLDTHVTSPSRLAGKGVSAGGLVMGVMANEHSALFQALVLKVPFVDILATMQDASLPLTVHEYDEWGGDPSHEQAVYDYIRAYAPCENVRSANDRSAVPYPSMLVTGSMNDQRVQFWEPVKWVYQLRELRRARHHLAQQMQRVADDDAGRGRDSDAARLLLLKMSEADGHFGGGGRLEQLQESAMEMAFLYEALRLPFP